MNKILKSKFSGENTNKAIPFIRNITGILNWTQAELKALYRKSRKILTMNHAFHAHSDVNTLTKENRWLWNVARTTDKHWKNI